MQVTGGTLDKDVVLSLERSCRNGAKQVFLVDSRRDGTTCVALASDGGRPSGIVSKRKVGVPLRESGPWDLSKRLWLYSVFTKALVTNQAPGGPDPSLYQALVIDRPVPGGLGPSLYQALVMNQVPGGPDLSLYQAFVGDRVPPGKESSSFGEVANFFGYHKF
ncbi:hypothetical protein LWI28_025148 [Acer negundo]|uniref:Uncharacterized protein n=1 Tax=Acer negundo TaxID=4023 RepID=A0AAD5JU97_ACENE|nr:hypothetical protein LWI28_025148 [Acer negundo]